MHVSAEGFRWNCLVATCRWISLRLASRLCGKGLHTDWGDDLESDGRPGGTGDYLDTFKGKVSQIPKDQLK